MEALTPLDLLQSLPGLLYAWSLIILGWGLVASAMFYKLHRYLDTCQRTSMRKSDKYTLWVLGSVNVLLGWYIFGYSPAADCTSWITVVNVFYTAHLAYVTLDIARWWKTVIRQCGQQPTVIIHPS